LQNAAQNLQDFGDIIASIDKMADILSMFEDTSSIGRALTEDLGEQLFLLSGYASFTQFDHVSVGCNTSIENLRRQNMR
jgi:hypothetical protein